MPHGDLIIPSFFVFPWVRLYNELKNDAPLGSVLDAQRNRWITVDGFIKQLKIFAERFSPTEKYPALLNVDGHSSNKALNGITFAMENPIYMLSVPSHTSINCNHWIEH